MSTLLRFSVEDVVFDQREILGMPPKKEDEFDLCLFFFGVSSWLVLGACGEFFSCDKLLL